VPAPPEATVPRDLAAPPPSRAWIDIHDPFVRHDPEVRFRPPVAMLYYDLQDPFQARLRTRSTTSEDPLSFDLKDPFRAPRGTLIQYRPPIVQQQDLRDPFLHGVVPCPTAPSTTAQGVVIQRPRSAGDTRTNCRPRLQPRIRFAWELKDPFRGSPPASASATSR
jgi:hypothetical protein